VPAAGAKIRRDSAQDQSVDVDLAGGGAGQQFLP
jgi:hypothetical protein